MPINIYKKIIKTYQINRIFLILLDSEWSNGLIIVLQSRDFYVCIYFSCRNTDAKVSSYLVLNPKLFQVLNFSKSSTIFSKFGKNSKYTVNWF